MKNIYSHKAFIPRELALTIKKIKHAISGGLYFYAEGLTLNLCNKYYGEILLKQDLDNLRRISLYFENFGNYKNKMIVDEKIKKLDESEFIDGFNSQPVETMMPEKIREKLIEHGFKYEDKYGRTLEDEFLRHTQRFRKTGVMNHENVLDLGSGWTYLSYICKYHNIYCDSIELPENDGGSESVGGLSVRPDHWTETYNILSTNVIGFKIQPFELFPKLPKKYDLIVAHQICFHGHKTDNLWGIDEWKFFLEDVANNILTFDGELNMAFNLENPEHKVVSQKGSDGKIFDEMIAVKGNFLGSAEIDKFFRPFYTGDKAKNPFFNISIKHVDIKKMLSS